MIKSKTSINRLKELPFYASTERVKNSIAQFDSVSLSKDEMEFLKMFYPDFPVIPVEGKCYLIAINNKSFTGLAWACSWFSIDSAFMDKNNIYHVNLKVRDKIVDVDYGMLYPKDITGLANYGIVINVDFTYVISKYILRKISALEIEEQISNIGFVDNSNTLEFNAYDKNLLSCTQDTDVNTYTGGLNRLLTNPAIMLALCSSCASLFLAYLSMRCGITLQSFIISFYGKSTTGKSTAQTMMTSVYTKPDDNKLYIPFFGTVNAIIKNLSNKFGVPQIFDEATVSSGLNMESLLYTITLEHDKSRCNSNATLKNSDTWKTIVITSSENRLLPETRMHNKGLDARLLSFGDLRYTDSREHSDQIHDFCNRNYGILGKILSEYLLNAQPERVTQMYTQCKEDLRNAIGKDSFFDLTERLINEYALILMSATVLNEFHINIDIDSVTAILIDNHKEIAEKSNIAEKFYNHIMTYVAMNPLSTAVKTDQGRNTVAIIDEAFLKILTSHGASNTDLVIRELDSNGYICRTKPNSIKSRRRFNGTLANCYEIYLPEDNREEYTSLKYILTNYEGLENDS